MAAWVRASSLLMLLALPVLSGAGPAHHGLGFGHGLPAGHGWLFGHHPHGPWAGPVTTITYRPPIYLRPGPGGAVAYSPSLVVVAPGGGFFPPPPPPPVLMPAAPGLDPPPDQAPAAIRPPGASKRAEAAERSRRLVTIGDRLFRAGNLSRAEERYQQALKAEPGSARPRLRLAQVALARNDYHEAATRLREAYAADPGWLHAPEDVEGLWSEPRRFAAMLGAIEGHLQAHPEDRDAWLVLGAELLLSGRKDRAGDVFLCLTDRQPDAILTAFLGASREDAGKPMGEDR